MALFNEKTESETTPVKATKKSGAASKTAGTGRVSASLRGVIIQPRISEKAAKLAQIGKYMFLVAKDANKISVRNAIEQLYTVHVIRVNILNTEGKKRNYGKTNGKMSDFKKAIVTLKAGEKIEAAEAV